LRLILVIKRTAPRWLAWLEYLSWLSFANEALVINEWEGVTNFSCTTTIAPFCETGGFTGDMIIQKLDFKTVCMIMF
jgi:hypothetical protein